jgi:hypothetical protein
MKTTISLFLSTIILLFACCLVFAQENRWSYVGTDASGTRFFVDRNSIEVKGNRLRVWNKFFYVNNTYRLSLFEWACAEKKYLILDETSYAPNGRVIGMDRASGWLFVTPESMSETLYKAICSSSKLTPSKPTPSRLSAGETMVEITVNKANLRDAPNINSNIIKEASIGERFTLVNNELIGYFWYQITLPGTNETAWIHRSTIKLVESPIKPKSGKRRKQSNK